MGQNFALNIASKGFPISVYNRSVEKMHATVARAEEEKVEGLTGYETIEEFVGSLQTPRAVIILIKAGKPVDMAIESLMEHLEPGDMIIDGGNEWYENTQRRAEKVAEKGLLYMGMGVSGGEEGARYGPSLMPGGPKEGYDRVSDILEAAAAQVDDGPCVTYIGEGGAGNYVKMVHNGIEYGDMQLIAEAYDILKNVGGLSNDELAEVFEEWNKGPLDSFLIEITAQIFKKKDEQDESVYLVDKVLDSTGSKGTGKWTVQEGAEQGIAVPTMAAALDVRYISTFLEERKAASEILSGPSPSLVEDKAGLIEDVRQALYASKICSYAQGMNLIKTAGEKNDWNLNLGMISRIWKGGCIIRAVFLDRIKAAYDRDSGLASLLVDPEFAAELASAQESWRRIVGLAITNGVPTPALAGSLAYYDGYRRERLPANLTQAQRDFFGAHTYRRIDADGIFHSHWADATEKASGPGDFLLI
jgi:6-phosphogluconate dehydrogenase